MNSVQRLGGQWRPVLMGLLMSAACVTTACADDAVALTTVAQLPEGVEVRGKQVAAYTWDDRQGKNLLVLAEQISEREDDGTQSAFVYAAQYLIDGDRPKRMWMLYDDVQHCEFDAALRFDMAATKVTDLAGDGTTQATVGYTRTCTSDVSPNEFKLIMHVGKAQKYRLRGVDRGRRRLVGRRGRGTARHAAAQGLQRRRATSVGQPVQGAGHRVAFAGLLQRRERLCQGARRPT